MKKQSLLFSLSCLALGNLIFSNSTAAQVTTDGTTNTTVNSDNNGNFTIEQGDRAGSNLFHSFGDFSVPTNGSALFNNATDVSNIFSRVTGGNISNIDGLIGASGSANLFLINPAGIMFGNNARLNIGGSFFGTTADSILFEDGEFSATNLDNPPLLTINAPIGLNFRDNPEDITNRAGFQELNNGETFEDGGLTVNRGEFITFVGGNINLENGRLTAPGGKIELGGLAEAGTIQLDEDLSLNFAEDLTRSDVSLTGIAELDVTSGGGGDINIFAQNINVRGGSDICAGIGADGSCGSRNDDFGSVDAQGGDITFDAVETITIGDRFSDINNDLNSDAFGNTGNINIKAKSLFLNDGGRINADIYGEGNAGNIVINTEFTNIFTSNISSGIFGMGNAGDIIVNASESLEISGDILTEDGEVISPGGILNQVERNAVGQGGDLTIETPLLNVSNGGKVQVATFGEGTPGNLSIRASDINVFDTEDSNNQFLTGIFASISLDPRNEQLASGEATNLTIETETLSVRGGATVSAETLGIGNGSNIFINASELVEIAGTDNKDGSPSIINADVGSPNLDTSVNLTEISRIGGNITIDTKQLNIRDGGQISASNFTAGNAGSVNVFSENIEIDGGVDGLLTGLFAQVGENAIGDGGNINLQVDDTIRLENNSFISARAFGNADGGNLTIDTNFIIAFPSETAGNGNDIVASAVDGEGGNIKIEAESLLGIRERTATLENRTNDIDASSEFGLDGTISIFTPDINPVQGATELPNSVVEPEQTVTQACAKDRGSVANSFVVKGRGGIPTLSNAPLSSETITVGGESEVSTTNSTTIATENGNITLARGVIKTAEGQIILTPTPVNGGATRTVNGSPNCS